MIAMALAEGSSDLVTRVAEKVKAKFLEENSGHDWHHISRVRKLAWQIAGQEGANQEVAELAALVHAGTRRDRLRIIGTSRSSRRKGGRNQTRPLSNYLTVRHIEVANSLFSAESSGNELWWVVEVTPRWMFWRMCQSPSTVYWPTSSRSRALAPRPKDSFCASRQIPCLPTWRVTRRDCNRRYSTMWPTPSSLPKRETSPCALSSWTKMRNPYVEQARAVQGQIRPLSNYLAVATIGVEQARAVQGQITAAIKLPHRSLLEPNWSEKRQETCRCPLYITTLDQKRTKHHRSQ